MKDSLKPIPFLILPQERRIVRVCVSDAVVVVFSVAYVSRSGGMSNELNNIISRATNGVYEGVAIGGDRWDSFWLLFNTRHGTGTSWFLGTHVRTLLLKEFGDLYSSNTPVWMG